MKSTHTPTPASPRGRRFPGRHVAWAGALALGLVLGSALAGDKDDHNRVRAAVEAGEILPLPALLEQLQRSHPGQVLELELETQDGRWIYEVKLLQPDGRLLKLELDARDAKVLKLKQKGTREPGR